MKSGAKIVKKNNKIKNQDILFFFLNYIDQNRYFKTTKTIRNKNI